MNFPLMGGFLSGFFSDLKSLEAWPYVRLIQYRFYPIPTPSPPFSLCMSLGYVCNLAQRIYQIARIFRIHHQAAPSPDFALRISCRCVDAFSPHTSDIMAENPSNNPNSSNALSTLDRSLLVSEGYAPEAPRIILATTRLKRRHVNDFFEIGQG